MQFQERQRPGDAKHFFYFLANSGLIEFVLICDTVLKHGYLGMTERSQTMVLE